MAGERAARKAKKLLLPVARRLAVVTMPGAGVADSARHALRRLHLCLQGCGDRQSEAIADAIGYVVFCRRIESGREVSEVVLGWMGRRPVSDS